MPGIGFALRRLLLTHTLVGPIDAYAYAGVIGSGPWVFSIVGILLVGIFSASVVVPSYLVTQFQTSVTYLVAGSLILTGFVQLAFTRFVSDRLFEKRKDLILPNLHGLLLVVVAVASVLGTLALFLLLPGQALVYRLLMLAGFTVMCGVWILTILLSGMKRYKAITVLFGRAYVIIVAASLLMRPWGLAGLLGGFVLGHLVLLMGMWLLIVREFNPQGRLIAFDFAQRSMLYPSLIAVGFLYNFGIWVDKFMFWYFAPTSEAIIGGLRASLIYDLPVFLSYLSIIPGMAVFLVRIETDFVEFYDKFYDAVRSGGSLEYIESMRDEMVYSTQQGLGEIAKIQTLAVLVTLVAGPSLLNALGMKSVSWYTKADAWPTILVWMKIWKSAGMNAVIYLAAITGLDELFDQVVHRQQIPRLLDIALQAVHAQMARRVVAKLHTQIAGRLVQVNRHPLQAAPVAFGVAGSAPHSVQLPS